jgi:hypothetical protein
MYLFVVVVAVASSSTSESCIPQISGLSQEFVSDNVVVISSVANVSSVRVVCSSNSSLFLDLAVDAV